MFLEAKIERMAAGVRAAQNIPMELRLWNGRKIELGDSPKVRVTVPKASALGYFLSPDLLKLGQAYVEGHIAVEGSLRDVFDVAQKFARSLADPGRLRGFRRMARHTKSRDREAIHYHYDVSNEFYSLFLDTNMVYSCAYFKSGEESLNLAQEQKLDHILTKLRVQPGERLLDIGCGWGALIIRAAQKYGAIATGITLSENQHALALERIEEAGVADRCEVRLQDYRDVPEKKHFDKISSVGMFEHVGLKNLPAYFAKMRALLAPNGVVMNHGITSVDPDSRSVGLGAGAFIDRYVFPDGELPHISLVLREMEAAGFEVADVESLRRHYAKTCGMWADGLETHRARAIEIAGDKRYRIWAIYLAGCAYAFANDWINIYQVLASPRNAGSLPLTRDYMYA